MNLSFYTRFTDVEKAKDITFNDYFNTVLTGGAFRSTIENARKEFEKNGKSPRYKGLKATLPLVTGSCTIKDGAKSKSKENIEDLNGLIVLDIDFDSIEDFDAEVYQKVVNDPYTTLIHKSISGAGFCVFVKINSEKFLESFKGLEKYYFEKFDLTIDKSCKNENRLRYISFDEGAILNEHGKKFTQYLKEKPIPAKSLPNILFDQDELGAYVNRIIENGVSITDTYEKWLSIAMAIKSAEAGEIGFSYFDSISQMDLNYNARKCRSKWDSIEPNGQTTLGTLYYYGKLAGVTKIYSDEFSRKIELISNNKKISGGIATVKETQNYINTIEPELEVEPEFIEKVLKSDIDFSKEVRRGASKFETLEAFIRDNYAIKRSSLTYQYSIQIKATSTEFEKYDAKYHENLIFRDVRRALEDVKEFTQAEVKSIIQLMQGEGEFSEIDEFLLKNRDYPINNELQRLCDSITLENQSDEYKEIFLKKWLCGLFSHKGDKNNPNAEKHSPLTLVLVGNQGEGKTFFLKRLLPPELNFLFANFEAPDKELTNDQKAQMSTKLILNNDEFNIRKKKSSDTWKRVTSEEILNFRRPYAPEAVDEQRICMFSGTCNELGILTDPTGNRRIIPFHVKNRDQNAFDKIDRTALFMEIYALYIKDPKIIQLTASDRALLADNTEDMISQTLEDEILLSNFTAGEDFYTVPEILGMVENMEGGRSVSEGLLRKALLKASKGSDAWIIQKQKKIRGVNNRGYLLKRVFNN